MDQFISELKKIDDYDIEENAFESIWNRYERVLIESLLSSFALDFIINDQYGGDVDTVNNVRKIGEETGKNKPQMQYKNQKNAKAYEERGKYDTKEYHNYQAFRDIKHNSREKFDNTGEMIADRYVEGNTLIPRHNDTIPLNRQAELDHIISAERVHNDRGRVLSGLSGIYLANQEDNLAYTNSCLNRNMSNMSVEEYITWCENNPDKVNFNGNKGEHLPESVKSKLREEYERSRKNYDSRINTAYYTGKQFQIDTAQAAGKLGLKMGLREALGFILAEVWFSTKKSIKELPENSDFSDIVKAVRQGIEGGIKNAKDNYKEIIAKLGEGFVSGVLASISTTIINMFFSTPSFFVKNIREIYASVTKSLEVLLVNPRDLLLGERIKESSIIMATGASVLAGTYVGGKLAETPVGAIPVLGDIIIRFCSTLVSGLLSCTFLVFLDRSKFINDLIIELNKLPSEVTGMNEIIECIDNYVAELQRIDIDLFKSDCDKFEKSAEIICLAKDEKELSNALIEIYSYYEKPWSGNFNDFMSDKNNRLLFG